MRSSIREKTDNSDGQIDHEQKPSVIQVVQHNTQTTNEAKNWGGRVSFSRNKLFVLGCIVGTRTLLTRTLGGEVVNASSLMKESKPGSLMELLTKKMD